MSLVLSDLGASILAIDRAVTWVVPRIRARTGTLSEDPFRLDLPAVGGPVSGSIDAATLEILGGLYLIGQLEQTGMLRAGELLIDNRFALDLRSLEAAELLDRLAVEAREWYESSARDQLHARVFGLGPRADSSTANVEFAELLLDLCSAITSWDDAARFGGATAAARTGAVRHAARLLRGNLAFRQHGNTLIAAERLAGQVRACYDLLRHPGIVALVAGTSMWDVVRALWADGEPDIDRHLTMGLAGQQLIGWTGSPGAAAHGEPSATAAEAARSWLLATGFDAETIP